MVRSHLSIITLSCLALWVRFGLGLPSSSTSSTLMNASYDDIKAIPGADEANSLNIYDGLQYTDFSVSNTSLQVSGLGPHSRPNLISSSATQQLTSIPAVSVLYSGTPYSSFSLISFFFGCFATTAQGLVASTAACTLQVTSYRAGSTSPAAIANFEFAPAVSDLTSSPMIEAVLPPDFTDVQTVTINQAPAVADGFGLDNLVYTLKNGAS